MFFNSRKKLSVYIFCTCCCLFLSSIASALNEAKRLSKELSSAIVAGNKNVVKKLLAQGADPRTINFIDELLERRKKVRNLIESEQADNAVPEQFLINELPSVEIAKLLLDNQDKSLDPSVLLSVILDASCKKYNPTRHNFEINNELLAQQYQLAELALSKNATLEQVKSLVVPSLALGKLLLNNKEKLIDPSTFLNLIFSDNCGRRHYQIDNQEWHAVLEFDKELLERQYQLVDLALRANADPKNIKSFALPPSLELSKLLLDNKEKSLDPKVFIDLVFSAPCILLGIADDMQVDMQLQNKLLTQRRESINYALTLTPDLSPEQISYYKEKLIVRNQILLQKNLGLALSKAPSLETEAEFNLAEEFKNGSGYCYGLTMVWLYSMWLQFTQPETVTGYNNDWFKKITKAISIFDEKQALDDESNKDLLRFATIVDFLQGEDRSGLLANLAQSDIEQRVILSLLNTNNKSLQRKYSLVSVFTTTEQICAALKELVHDDELVYVGFVGHAVNG